MFDLVTSFSTCYIFTSGHNYAVFGAYCLFRFVKDVGLGGMVPVCPHVGLGGMVPVCPHVGLDGMVPVCPHVSQLLDLPHDRQLQIVLPSIGYCK